MDALSLGAAGRVAVAARATTSRTTLLWVNDVAVGHIETYVTLRYDNRNVSGPIDQVVARTRDVIETVLDMATEIHPTLVLDTERTNLPLRLEAPAGQRRHRSRGRGP